MACVVLPANRLCGQTIGNYELDTDRVIGAGVSYTIPTENNNYGIGIQGNFGVATQLNMLDTKFNTGAALLLDSGVARFNTDANKYLGQIGASFKLNVGYGPVALEYVKSMEWLISNNKMPQVLDIHGGGISAQVGEYLKIYADFLYTTPLFEGRTQNTATQKYSVQTGILYTLSRKTR